MNSRSSVPAAPPVHPRRALLLDLWNAALQAVSGDTAVRAHLPPLPAGRVVVVGAGKAAAAMAVAAAATYGAAAKGVVVTRRGYGLRPGETSGGIRVIEASHPIPDGTSREGARAVLKAVDGLGADDLVLCLLSGGGSALIEDTLPGIGFEETSAIYKALLESGATISDINCVRKHLSAVKGGRLAIAAWPAHVLTLAISDVPGDDPSVIASGPTCPDPTTNAQALAILRRFRIALPPGVAAVLGDDRWETPKADDPRFAQSEFRLVATQADALHAASRLAAAHGFKVHDRGTSIEGEARAVADEEARLALDHAATGEPAAILAGGELTVTLDRYGLGGPSREYALALAMALNGHPGVWALAADTDGIDGSDDAAGAFVTPDTLARARERGLDPQAALMGHESGGFFTALGDSLVTGPTRTNVSDFRVLLVDGAPSGSGAP